MRLLHVAVAFLAREGWSSALAWKSRALGTVSTSYFALRCLCR